MRGAWLLVFFVVPLLEARIEAKGVYKYRYKHNVAKVVVVVVGEECGSCQLDQRGEVLRRLRHIESTLTNLVRAQSSAAK